MMQDHSMIDGLIGTFRELNARVRPLPEDRLRIAGNSGGSVREVIRRMKDSELRFSQALKERITGVSMPDMFGGDEAPVVGTEGEDDSTAVILSQFGTARESTLAMLRTMPPDDWDSPVEGGKAVRVRVQELVSNDRQQMERIVGLLGAP